MLNPVAQPGPSESRDPKYDESLLPDQRQGFGVRQLSGSTAVRRDRIRHAQLKVRVPGGAGFGTFIIHISTSVRHTLKLRIHRHEAFLNTIIQYYDRDVGVSHGTQLAPELLKSLKDFSTLPIVSHT